MMRQAGLLNRAAAIMLAVFILTLVSDVGAQQGIPRMGGPTDSPLAGVTGMDERVSLELRSTEVTDALKYLASKGGINISISKNVTGRVNLFLTDVPIRDVFELILRSNELAYERQGNVYHIMTEAEYRSLYGRRFADVREVRTFKLNYAVPEQAFNLLDTLKSEVGRLLVDEESGTVLIMDTPTQLDEMEQALKTMESGGDLRVFDLSYANATDLEEQLNEEVELKSLGFVKADTRTNQLIVKTLPGRMDEFAKMIEALDRKDREVLIDAKIVKVNLTDGVDAGINWDSVFTNLTFHGIDTTNSFRLTTTGTAPTEVPGLTRITVPEIGTSGGLGNQVRPGDLVFGTVSRDGYELFRYLQTLGNTKIVSNPRLMVTENKEARIHVGTREAYVTTTTTTGQTTTTTAEEVEFIDVGIQLLVTPRINAEGYISMDIKPEISSVVRTLVTPSNNQIPIVDTATAETRVVVRDGMTVVVGGLWKDERKNTDRQLPYLGNLPIVGPALFRTRNKDNERAELVVFITPRIVEGETLVTGDEAAPEGDVKPFREYESFPIHTQMGDTADGR